MSSPVSSREVARRVLDRIDKDGAWATPALDGELARAGLDDRDRRLASELVYGVLRHRTRLDRALSAHANLKKTQAKVVTALRIAAYQLLFLDRIPGHAAVNDAVAAAREVGGPKVGGFANAVLRNLSRAGEPPLPEGDLELATSLPRWILDELKATAGADLPAIAAAFAQSAPLIARANLRKTTREALIAELAVAGVTATPVGIKGSDPFYPRSGSGGWGTPPGAPRSSRAGGPCRISVRRRWRSPRRRAPVSGSSTRVPASAARPRTSPS
ncbi:MAG: hypothetical protein IPQ07_45630 [Myxococcales bacterium]|nr:hypothetical protein [Myxococcales bacterium]